MRTEYRALCSQVSAVVSYLFFGLSALRKLAFHRVSPEGHNDTYSGNISSKSNGSNTNLVLKMVHLHIQVVLHLHDEAEAARRRSIVVEIDHPCRRDADLHLPEVH